MEEFIDPPDFFHFMPNTGLLVRAARVPGLAAMPGPTASHLAAQESLRNSSHIETFVRLHAYCHLLAHFVLVVKQATVLAGVGADLLLMTNANQAVQAGLGARARRGARTRGVSARHARACRLPWSAARSSWTKSRRP